MLILGLSVLFFSSLAFAQERTAGSGDALREEIAALDRAIVASPGSAELHVRRGGAWFRAADNDRALRDFDRAVALDRRLLPYLWQRGISLYYARRFEDCVEQFESHRLVNGNDVENAAWHLLCLARLEGLEKARKGMLPVGPDPRRPMTEIDALYRGRGSAGQVLEAAGGSASGQFYAELYLGLFAHAEGRNAEARAHLERANALDFPHYMGDVARLHWQLWDGEP